MHYVCCMKKIIALNNPLTKLFEIYLEYDLHNGFKLKNKIESIKESCKGIMAYSIFENEEDSKKNFIKSFANYHSICPRLKSRTSFNQELMSSNDHVPSVKRSGELVFKRLKDKADQILQQEGISCAHFRDKIIEFLEGGEIKYLLRYVIGVKLTKIQHGLLKNDKYNCLEQLKGLHYKDLNTVIRTVKSLKKEVKEMHQKGLGPIVFHKKFDTPKIEHIPLKNKNGNFNKYGLQKIKKEIKNHYEDQGRDVIFYTGFFKKLSDLETCELDKYIDEELEEINLEPSSSEWGSRPGVKELIEVFNMNIRPADQHNKNLINNKKEEGALSLFSESISVFAPSSF